MKFGYFAPTGVAVGYFDSWDAALLAVENEPSQYKAAYFTLNPIKLPTGIPLNPHAFTPSRNAAGAADIAQRTWLLIDLDPPRPAGTNSTDAEKQAAREQAEQVREYLSSRGWPMPKVCSSGNGWHLLYPIDLPNDDNATGLVRGTLARLHQLFPMVDPGNFDPPRLCKLYGSWARKGEHSEERPWRRSAIVEEGSATIVTEQQLSALLPALTRSSDTTVKKSEDVKLSSLLGFLDHYGVPLRSKPREVNGGWQVEIECPWSIEHSDEARRDTVVSFIADLGFGFKCFHAHCSHRHWREFRAELERRFPERRFSFVGDEAPSSAKITFGGGTPVSAQGGAEDAEVPPAKPRPRYPEEDWKDTFYWEFADLCTRDNYIPKKFFIEAIRTVTGALVGNQLRGTLDGVIARLYTVLITTPGGGKGTALERVLQLFCSAWESETSSVERSMLIGSQDWYWRKSGIGAQIVNPASAPGLMKALELRRLKKDEVRNPAELWQPKARFITIQEEVRGLFANFQNESTGAGLESVLCELYDRTSFSTTATKDRQPDYGELMYSILGGITKEGWDGIFSKVASTESGFLSRINIVGSEEERRVESLTIPDFSELRNRFFPLIKDLAKHPRVISHTDDAKQAMGRWFNGLALPDGVQRSRLNIHAWRAALHIAWLKGHEQITVEDVEVGTRSADYQVSMREYYAPPEGETRQARCEQTIRKVMRGRRRLTVRQLRQSTNYRRFGIGLWDKSLASLVRAGEMRIEETDTGKRIVILLKERD
jgi:hypothetical protein